VLLDFDDSLLQIDRPQDWPGTHFLVYILFKDDTQVWNRLKAEVKEISRDTLYLEFPRRLVRLQRRSNYRVEPPRGSTARFILKGKEYSAQKIMDISADGMRITPPGKGTVFAQADELSAINLSFPGEGAGFSTGTAIVINRGAIVRVARDDHYNFCYGVHFYLDHSEEISLLQYVRQRERELLRRGLADE
jgi:c-di-GMP-binding flagellar brake protein YcgR